MFPYRVKYKRSHAQRWQRKNEPDGRMYIVKKENKQTKKKVYCKQDTQLSFFAVIISCLLSLCTQVWAKKGTSATVCVCNSSYREMPLPEKKICLCAAT